MSKWVLHDAIDQFRSFLILFDHKCKEEFSVSGRWEFVRVQCIACGFALPDRAYDGGFYRCDGGWMV